MANPCDRRGGIFRDSETTRKIKFALLMGVGRGGREENCPKTLGFLGKRHDNKIWKLQILLLRNVVVIAQAPRFNTLSPRFKGPRVNLLEIHFLSPKCICPDVPTMTSVEGPWDRNAMCLLKSAMFHQILTVIIMPITSFGGLFSVSRCLETAEDKKNRGKKVK